MTEVASWDHERNERIRGGARTFAKVAIVIFLVFWAMDLMVFPEQASWFLALRVICAAGYVLLLPLIARVAEGRALSAVSVLTSTWVTLIICMMLVETGYEDSLYYAGIMVVMLAMGVLMPMSWMATLAAGLLNAGMYVCVALANPEMDAVTAFNNTGFILGALGIALTANIRGNAAARAEHLGREKLAEAYSKLKEMDRLKSEFFANVSHELRTPLTLILAPLADLITQQGARLEPSVQRALTSMRRNAVRLLQLINNLLDLSKLEAGKLKLAYEPVDLHALTRAVLPPFQTVAQQRRIEVELTGETVEPVHVDAEKIEIVLQNLLANAIKFTAEDGTVRVAVDEDATCVRVRVDDTGIGISAADLPRIFDRFKQADGQATRRFGGTGIGLALVKEIVEVHGGAIEVSSELGVGSSFLVSLPKGEAHIRPELREVSANEMETNAFSEAAKVRDVVADLRAPAEAEDPLEEEAECEASSNSSERVLVVEDNPELRDYLRRLLSRHYRVEVAEDGQAGLEKALELRPDLVLSDVMMPRLSGYDLVRALKSDARTRATPVILLSAKRGVEPTVAGFIEGADDYLSKPFTSQELLARIHAQLRLRRLSKQLARAEKMALMGTVTAGLAHEVRNPVNAILSSVEVLRRSVDEDDRRSNVLLGVVDDCGRRIDRIVGDLLAFGADDAGDLGAWDPVAGVESTLALLAERLGERQVACVLDFEGEIQARGGQLNQVLLNLLDNALRATGPEGRIEIHAEAAEQGFQLVVADDGVGIHPDDQRHVFDPFFTTREAGEGSGLGLHLSREIVERHGGRIRVESQPGEGARFTVWLPAELPAAQAA